MSRQLRVALLVATVGLVACNDSGLGGSAAPNQKIANVVPSRASVPPLVIEGNPTCATINPLWKELKVEPPVSGTYTTTDGLLTVVVTVDQTGTYFDWSANKPVMAVLAKGGPAANVFVYSPPSRGDTQLASPVNPGGGPAQLSHISFCYDEDFIILYGLDLSKTAATRLDRSWTWEIDKTADQSNLTLSVGQQFLVNYSVKATATSVDSDWEIYGTIVLTNTNSATEQDIRVNSVTDLAPPAALVSCPVTFPHFLAPSASLTCTYVADAAAPGSGTNTATVSATRGAHTADFEAYAPWDFAAATIDVETDECIQVTDDRQGALGTVCASNLPFTFTYSMYVGPYTSCAEYSWVNTASFRSNDTGAIGSDSWTIPVTVPCTGCTLTPGYWKTHSTYGPAPYDATWALLGEDTPFFLSGKSYYGVLWTPPTGGNAYYILAHAWIAAKLNILDGADPAAVAATLAQAQTFFDTYTPTATLPRNVRTHVLELAGILDRYDNGLIGPGHCSE